MKIKAGILIFVSLFSKNNNSKSEYLFVAGLYSNFVLIFFLLLLVALLFELLLLFVLFFILLFSLLSWLFIFLFALLLGLLFSLFLFWFSFFIGTENNISILLLFILLFSLFSLISSFLSLILTPFGFGGRKARKLTMNFIDKIIKLIYVIIKSNIFSFFNLET